jgi:repressor LexA
MDRQPLTSRQQEILDYLESFTQRVGYPPTVREICKATGLKSPRSVSQHLQALERKGYIHRGRDKSRAIRFLHKSITAGSAIPDSVVALPVLGKVSAGQPLTASEASDLTYLVDRQLVEGDKSFLLKVEGNSMIDAHIVEGDYIVINPEPEAATGDIVVAKVRGELTVKRYEVRGTGTYLVPQNSGMRPIDVSSLGEDVEIVGKVVGLIRTMV